MDSDAPTHSGFNLRVWQLTGARPFPLARHSYWACMTHASKITLFFSMYSKVQLLDPALSGASTFKMRQTGFITKDAGDEKQWCVWRCQSLNAGISHRASASLICCLSLPRTDKCITITRKQKHTPVSFHTHSFSLHEKEMFNFPLR